MNALRDPFELDFTKAYDSPPQAAPTLETSSAELRNEAVAKAAQLQSSGYCVNIVRRALKLVPIAPEAKYAILCIDDELPVLAMLARKLSRDGYEVRTASDRESIIAELKKLPNPNLILLDVGLPGLSGFDLLLKLRQHPVLKNVPVIMLTGHVRPEDVLHGMANGADGYVSKPFRFEALMGTIKTVLGIP